MSPDDKSSMNKVAHGKKSWYTISIKTNISLKIEVNQNFGMSQKELKLEVLI